MTMQENGAKKRPLTSQRATRDALLAEGKLIVRPREMKKQKFISTLNGAPLTVAEVQRLAAIASRGTIEILRHLASHAKMEAVRTQAIKMLHERAFGMPNQPITASISVVESLSLEDRERFVEMITKAIPLTIEGDVSE